MTAAANHRQPEAEERYAVVRGPKGRWWVLRPGCTLEIGRDPACALAIPSPMISRRHALLRWLTGQPEPELRDEGSANGTTVNGRAVRRSEFRPLRDGATVHLGDPHSLLTVELHTCGRLPEALRAPAPAQGRLGRDCTALELLRHLERGALTCRTVITCRDGEVTVLQVEGWILTATGWGAEGERVLDRLLQVQEGEFLIDGRVDPARSSLALPFSAYLARHAPAAPAGARDHPARLTERLREPA